MTVPPSRPDPTPSPTTTPEDLGAVAIGRNEGERLIRCLDSLAGKVARVVYVDSGSTDGSVEAARARGVEVVELDLSVPFTAARARNAGLDRLLELAPGLRYVQFVDGDCELADGWLDRGREALESRPELAVACGRRRERAPEASLYNRLADLEWDTPVGDADSCGGDAMMRVEALLGVGGYDPTLIAGEEPDLCLRLRAEGWKVARLDAEMTSHDLAMTRFGQWWRRLERAGHAYAEGAARHAHRPGRPWARQVASIAFWGLALPAAAIGLAWPTSGLSLSLLLGYPVIAARAARGRMRRGTPVGQSALYGASCAVSKFPQAIGLLRYAGNRLLGRRGTLIEYKGVAGVGEAAR
ncbi:glycosyltransferase family 2 protein [Tautonia sociabilis]|uniref:Glycosyltransferase family 2 protein n=1 Tax=Tautonia sociabilis TaxID=2080755 RepID=A0A432MFM0_9BACT|nr:glycosyltransferase [Tautonia sociabilis]RUL84929.1 glycosyltransferase family 2 protein [Tautonia sociabilis]